MGHRPVDHVQSGTQQRVYRKEGKHNSEGSHGPHAQTGEQEVQGRGKEQKYGLGYMQLEKLAVEEPSEIVLVLANSRAGFEALVKQPLRPDLLILIVRILSNLCKADFEENKAAVLSCACVHEFVDQLSKHIAVIPLEVNKVRKDNVGSFLDDLMTFLETVINLLLSKAVEGFENLFMMTDLMIKFYEGQQLMFSNFDEVKKKFEYVRARYKICVEEQERKDVSENSNAVAVESVSYTTLYHFQVSSNPVQMSDYSVKQQHLIPNPLYHPTCDDAFHLYLQGNLMANCHFQQHSGPHSVCHFLPPHLEVHNHMLHAQASQ